MHYLDFEELPDGLGKNVHMARPINVTGARSNHMPSPSLLLDPLLLSAAVEGDVAKGLF